MAIENILQETEKNEFISILQKLRHGEAINAEEWINIKNVREQLICMQYINSQLEYSEDSSEQMEQLFKNFFFTRRSYKTSSSREFKSAIRQN